MYFYDSKSALLQQDQFSQSSTRRFTMIRGKQIRTLAVLMAFVWAAQTAFAQDRAQTESRVSAELVKGKLNPATSKPGDEIAVRLQDDVKSNGQVVMKKGSTIKGVVKKVQRADNKSNAKANGAAQSMMELEWVDPGLSGAASQSLNLALQSVVYTNPLAAHPQESSNEEFPARVPASSPRSSGGGGLGAGVVGGVTGIVGGTASSVGAVAGAGTQGTASVARPHAISPVSTETSSNLQNSLGMSAGPLFHVGSGQSISGSGSATSMDIFSHMSNDAVITSPSRDFEISSGAQMQLLVQGSTKK
jgi:hypothetical protein